MAYYLQQFDSQALPTGNSVDGLGTGAVASTLVAVAGGVIDIYGANEIAPMPSHTIRHRGIYSASVESNVDALRAYLGRRKKLYRFKQSDSSQQWKWARLLDVQWDRDVAQRSHAEIEAIFEAVGWWKATTPDTANISASGSLALTNGGTAYATDGTFTFVASGTGAKTIRVVNSATGIDWTWTGSITDTKSLLIDCGAFSVLNNGADAYSGLTLNAGHTSNYWMVAAPGLNTWTVTLTGAGTLTVSSYDSWV